MKATNPTFVASLLLSALMLLSSSSTVPASGRNPNSSVLPANASPYGRTYSQWSAAWWQWAYSIPLASNPVADETGEFAANGQGGPVWFLAGTFGGDVTREVTVPAGKALFFPIINTVWISLPDYGDAPWSPEQREFAFSVISPFIDNAFYLSCEVDGVSVTNLESYRHQTAAGEEYRTTVPADNITQFLPAGTYGPTVDDGIYLLLAPLKPGRHTIHFTAASSGSALRDYAADVTCVLTVQ